MGAEESAAATTRAIVLDGAAPVALAVDVVEALVTVETDQIETRQAELATRPGERLKGAFAADGKNAIAKILDIEGLIGAAFVQEARRGRARAGQRRGAGKSDCRRSRRRRPADAGELRRGRPGIRPRPRRRSGDHRYAGSAGGAAGQRGAGPGRDAVSRYAAAPAVAARPARLHRPGRTHRSREDRRHPGRRRPGRPAGRPHAQHLSGRCRPDREDPAGAVGTRRAGKPRSRRSIAAKTDDGWCRFWRRSNCSGRTSCSG